MGAAPTGVRGEDLMDGMRIATFGGGCFWCLEAVFERLPGVSAVVSGYAGGKKPNPTYREVCSGTTGHAEVVNVHFDPQKITFEELLNLFWTCHDPTTLNRQGADVGSQYRSVIYYQDEDQRLAAEASKAALAAAGTYANPIVTEIAPLDRFYEAEDYHQDYFRNNADAPYCRYVILPKLSKVFAEEPSS